MIRYYLVMILCVALGCNSMDIKKQSAIVRKQLFDDNWKFNLGDIPAASTMDFDDKNWPAVELPHDWSIEGEIDPNNAAGNDGGYFPTGIGWYRKTFHVPPEWQGRLISIYFEGVYMNSEVFINGTSLGVHPYGYTSFYYDLTPHLKFNRENTLAVRVNNSEQKNCRWYSGSGIYRHVWLMVTNTVHTGQWGIGINTTKVSHEEATVQVKTLVKNESGKPQHIGVLTQIKDKKTHKIGENKVTLELDTDDQQEVIHTLIVKDPVLWSPETPYLYHAEIELIQEGQTIDRTDVTFGIRSLEFSTDHGFQLNGKELILNGGCVHHDNGCLGAKAYDRAEERKIELLKSAGFNAVRTSHNPPSEAFLDACDKLGLLVIDEAFDGWKTSKTPYDYARFFEEWSIRDIESMVLRDRNHPSVIIWSIGNEIIERTDPEAVKTARILADAVRRIDPTRPVTSAMTTWDQGWEVFDPLFAVHDIGGYNYQLFRAPDDHKRVPSRIIVNTESYPGNAFNIWKLVQENSYIIGDFVWTALDYLGESGIGAYYYPGEQGGEHWQADRYPWYGAYCGDIDLTGWRKPISHCRNLLYNDTEKLYMAVREPNPDTGEIRLTAWAVWPTWESWTWPGHEGKAIEVEVVSKYPKVRLYLNEKLIGDRSTTKETGYRALFTIPYTPGIIKAEGLQEDNVMEKTVLQTAGDPAEIKLIPDREKITANGQDLSFITVEITDKDGNLQPNADNILTFSIEGPGEIIGVDNANLKDFESYVGKTRSAWHGRAMVVLKSKHEAGDINLKVRSEDIPEADLVIRSVADE
ncbi:MAG: DUF4982 domain-containing protein [Bacteroidales bacterium]|nr:DUF4982 domain-containing protein [Bacteroidales bacterium]MBN2761823.1 DUF4982 domain-containing protein [Bacteroidales bacterium]